MTEREAHEQLMGTYGVQHEMRVFECESARTGSPGATCEHTVAYVPAQRSAPLGGAA